MTLFPLLNVTLFTNPFGWIFLVIKFLIVFSIIRIANSFLENSLQKIILYIVVIVIYTLVGFLLYSHEEVSDDIKDSRHFFWFKPVEACSVPVSPCPEGKSVRVYF